MLKRMLEKHWLYIYINFQSRRGSLMRSLRGRLKSWLEKNGRERGGCDEGIYIKERIGGGEEAGTKSRGYRPPAGPVIVST